MNQTCVQKTLVQPEAFRAGAVSAVPEQSEACQQAEHAESQAVERMQAHVRIRRKHTVLAVAHKSNAIAGMHVIRRLNVTLQTSHNRNDNTAQAVQSCVTYVVIVYTSLSNVPICTAKGASMTSGRDMLVDSGAAVTVTGAWRATPSVCENNFALTQRLSTHASHSYQHCHCNSAHTRTQAYKFANIHQYNQKARNIETRRTHRGTSNIIY